MMMVSALSESIQLAVAPVFLLTAVAGMIGALTHRLARVIDRSRVLQAELTRSDKPSLPEKVIQLHKVELINLARRGRCINLSMILLVVCAIFIGFTVLELFIGDTSSGKLLISNMVLYSFIGGIGSFILALIALLTEVLIASYSIRWKPHTH